MVVDQGLLGECQGLPGMKVMRCREEGQGCLGTHTHTHNTPTTQVPGEGRVMGYLGGECQELPQGSQGCLGLRFLSQGCLGPRFLSLENPRWVWTGFRPRKSELSLRSPPTRTVGCPAKRSTLTTSPQRYTKQHENIHSDTRYTERHKS